LVIGVGGWPGSGGDGEQAFVLMASVATSNVSSRSVGHMSGL
jgi:hypothetical protein